MEKLTIRQAYIAMIRFLEQYYERSQSEDIVDLLSGLNLEIWKDGSSADPAMWQDWKASVEHVLSEAAEG